MATGSVAGALRGGVGTTVAGRRRQFEGDLYTQPFMRYASPAARSLISQQYFDPLSSRYLLAAAPSALGGYSGWEADPSSWDMPGGAGFTDFLSNPLRYSAGTPGTPAFAGEYDVDTNTWTRPPTPAVAATPAGYTAAPDMATSQFWQPWSRNEWVQRLGALDLPTTGTAEAWGAWQPDLTDTQRGYLMGEGGMTPAESQQIISSAALAGLNPIARRAMMPALNRAFAKWETEAPEVGGVPAGGGELLRRFYRSFRGPDDVQTVAKGWDPSMLFT